MAGKILIINQGTSLMVNRLVSLLKEAEIESAVVEPLIEKIDPAKNDVDIFVFFTGEFVYDSKDFLAYLGDMCHSVDKPLCLVGYDKEMEKVSSVIPTGVIAQKVPRPFDVKALAADLTALYKGEKELTLGKRLLLVDDDTTFLRMMQNCLGTNYKVAAASSGMKAIEYLANHTVDLILLDHDMPVTSGPQVLEMLRSEPATRHIPVIFLTGKNDRDSVMSVMSLKPEGYILKSAGSDDILKSVQNFFNKRKQ